MANPIVSAITPDASTVGARIKVTGSNLTSVTGATVGGVKSEIEHVTPEILYVIVASDAKTGPVVVSNEEGPAGTQPLFTVTVEPKPMAETKFEKLRREEREAQQKERADAEQAAQRARQNAAKTVEVPHHEPMENQAALANQATWNNEQKQWPGKNKKKW